MQIPFSNGRFKSHKKSSSAPLRSTSIGTNCKTCWGASVLTKSLNNSFTFADTGKLGFWRPDNQHKAGLHKSSGAQEDMGQENVMNLKQLWSTKIKLAINLVKQESIGKIITSPVWSCCNECSTSPKIIAGKGSPSWSNEQLKVMSAADSKSRTSNGMHFDIMESWETQLVGTLSGVLAHPDDPEGTW